jgi:hypothetical protein
MSIFDEARDAFEEFKAELRKEFEEPGTYDIKSVQAKLEFRRERSYISVTMYFKGPEALSTCVLESAFVDHGQPFEPALYTLVEEIRPQVQAVKSNIDIWSKHSGD